MITDKVNLPNGLITTIKNHYNTKMDDMLRPLLLLKI